ncbi:MAG: type II secretion system protein [Lentisphaeria bacterium]|nr:type II secretion system protein [Lentisphaeria bacterium]
MKKRDFTLVELLAVTALIAILAGIGFAAFSYASNRGREAATKSLITRIGAGLESVRTKHGAFPGATSYGDIVVTVNSSGLVTGITFGGTALSAKQLKTFLAICDGESLKKNLDGSGNVTDAWGGNVKYCSPGLVNTVKFDLVAPGPDEKFGTARASAPPATAPSGKTVLDNYKTDGEWSCDDIANFD